MAKTPIDILQKFAEDETLEKDLRINAAKALLPYTSKRKTESFEFSSTNVNLNADKLKDFSDDELRVLAGFIRRLTKSVDPGAGDTEETVQF
jgi:hypothetical protein